MNDIQKQIKELSYTAHDNQDAFFARFFPQINMEPPFTEELLNLSIGHKTCHVEFRMKILPQTTWGGTTINTDEYLQWCEEITSPSPPLNSDTNTTLKPLTTPHYKTVPKLNIKQLIIDIQKEMCNNTDDEMPPTHNGCLNINCKDCIFDYSNFDRFLVEVYNK